MSSPNPDHPVEWWATDELPLDPLSADTWGNALPVDTWGNRLDEYGDYLDDE